MKTIMAFFIFSLLLLSSPLFLQVAKCRSDLDALECYSSAPGVETTCDFPKNPGKLVVAGKKTKLLIGVKNEGDQNLKVLEIHASAHLALDDIMLVENLTTQPGEYDLVGTIVYEIDQTPYQNTFYNGTIEVTEGLFSIDTVAFIFVVSSIIQLVGVAVDCIVDEYKEKRAERERERAERERETAVKKSRSRKKKKQGKKLKTN